MTCDSSAEVSAGEAARGPPNTFVIGLGNPILGDDGVGWRVAEAVRAQCKDPDVKVECLAVGGLNLMEHLVGSKRAIIVDAIFTHQGKIGDVFCCPLNEIADPSGGHTTSAHDVSLQTAMEMGRVMGAALPQEVTVVSVEIDPVFEFSDGLSFEVADAVPVATETVLELLRRYQGVED
jgi:hydrogenase maturation protease